VAEMTLKVTKGHGKNGITRQSDTQNVTTGAVRQRHWRLTETSDKQEQILEREREQRCQIYDSASELKNETQSTMERDLSSQTLAADCEHNGCVLVSRSAHGVTMAILRFAMCLRQFPGKQV